MKKNDHALEKSVGFTGREDVERFHGDLVQKERFRVAWIACAVTVVLVGALCFTRLSFDYSVSVLEHQLVIDESNATSTLFNGENVAGCFTANGHRNQLFQTELRWDPYVDTNAGAVLGSLAEVIGFSLADDQRLTELKIMQLEMRQSCATRQRNTT